MTAFLALPLLAALFATAPVAERPDTGREPSVRVGPKRLAPRKTLRVSARGWPARKSVGLLVRPAGSAPFQVATVRTNRRGRFTRDLQISALAEPGRHVLLACRKGCSQKRRARFTITAP